MSGVRSSTVPMSLAEATAELTAPGNPFEIGIETIDGAEVRVWRNCPPSLRSILEASAVHGGATFLVYEDERVTFGEHLEEAAALAWGLAGLYGVRKGDRVAVAMRNLPEWVVGFWAGAALGAIVVPLNGWWTGPELAYGLEDSGTKVAVVDPERLARIAAHLDDLRRGGLEQVVVARAGDGPASPGLSGIDRFEDVLAAGRRLGASTDGGVVLPPAEVLPEDDATIFYTSGTTGKPKGALGTQRNICTNLMSLGFVNARSGLLSTVEEPAEPPEEPAQSSSLLSVPLFHVTGCHSVLVPNTAAGGKLVMMRRWSPERALELIERERVTIFGGVPTMAWQVLDSPDFSWRDTSSVRTVAYGGAPAPPELVRRIEEHFPRGSPRNGYGMTETSSITTMNAGEDYVRKPDSVGPPVPVCEVRVVGPDGSDVPTGDTGELLIKGPNVVRGYWNKPAATAASFTDGWLRTGDVAKLDGEGFVFIVDRAKDMVIRGGENVYSVEVEAAIFEHPAVVDAAVIGVPHGVLGEEVGAVVVLREGARVGGDELRGFLAERIAAFKIPSQIWFRADPLPRNPAGKVLKRDLRQEILSAE